METAPVTTLGSLFTYQFRGNSVFDPDLTGAGSQPSYFDNWANLYNSYVVLSSRIRIEVFGSTTGASPAPVLAGVFPAYNTATPTTALDGAAMRYSKSVSTSSAGGNAYKALLTNAMSTAQQFGISDDAVVFDDLYSATVTANPAAAQTWYWTVFAQVQSGSTTLQMYLRISLEYDVKFFDPVVVNLSAKRAPFLRVGPKVPDHECAANPTPGQASSATAAEDPTALPSERPASGGLASAAVAQSVVCPCEHCALFRRLSPL
jgi:hypothetical protein